MGLDEEQFLELDADRDGVVSEREFRRFVLRAAGKTELEVDGRVYWLGDQAAAAGPMTMDQALAVGLDAVQFAEVDADGDGVVSESEVRSFVLQAAGITELEVPRLLLPPSPVTV